MRTAIMFLALVLAIPASLLAKEKKYLIVGAPKLEVREKPDPGMAAATVLTKYAVMEIIKKDKAYQRNWYHVIYTDMSKSSRADTTGYIEVAPDLKDIVPIKLLREAYLYLSFSPEIRLKIDLMDAKWQYTDDIYEQNVGGKTPDTEIIKEWYKISTNIFLPHKAEGYVLQDNTFYEAFTEDDAVRRITAVKANASWGELYKEKILGGFITEKMNRKMVRASWGEPWQIQKGSPQIWLYGTKAQPIQVKFVRGLVSEWDK